MDEDRISLSAYCLHYRIDQSFIDALENEGLVSVIRTPGERYILHDQLAELERYRHLHYDLEINIEGIDAIRHLLRHLEELQSEMRLLKRRIQIYES